MRSSGRIPAKILSFDELKLPDALKKLCHLNEGLVVVTGPTGGGKSTTLAAMIDYINSNLCRSIVTIEDPIEFSHPQKKSVIVHREVGEHTESFAAALKGAMRHDPDIILLGEMRELETIKLALSCRFDGHACFRHAPHQQRAQNRRSHHQRVSRGPAEPGAGDARWLSCGVVAQLLLQKIPKGRIAVHEILLNHEALPNTIRMGQISNIKSIIESGGADGMITMDTSLMNAVKDKSIEPKELT